MSDKAIYFKCISDTDIYIMPYEDIISMTPVISQDNDPYIRVKFEDFEFCCTNTIYCSKIEKYSVDI